MRWRVLTLLFCTGLALGSRARADVLQEADELRRQLQYDAAAEKLNAALPNLQGESRARALLLLATVNDDPKESRRQLLEAAKAAERPETRRRATLEHAELDYGRGNYRSVQARLQELADDPDAALWLGMSAIALGTKNEVRATLEPAHKTDLGQMLQAWADLQTGDPQRGLAGLEPIVRRRRADLAPTALLWKAQCQVAMGNHDGAVETTAELRERWGDTPEVQQAEALVAAPRATGAPGGEPAATTERLALQVGSFEDRANALRFRERVGQDVRGVRLEETQSGVQRLYRVLVGSFETRDAAETFGREQLTPHGFTWQVVRVGEESGP